MKFDIPVNIEVDATNESRAERQVLDFLKDSAREFKLDYKIIDWSLLEFISEEEDIGCSNLGCRDNY
jgi:hypothetical protein